jgi:hypothetical protein
MASPSLESDSTSSKGQDNSSQVEDRDSSGQAQDSVLAKGEDDNDQASGITGKVHILQVQGESSDETSSTQQTSTEMTAAERRAAALAPYRIKPGEARNPRGRPKKDLDLARMAQQHAMKAVQTLAACLDDETASWPAKVSAASELLDRGFGRAPQSLQVDHKLDFSANFEAFVRELGDRRAGRLPPAVIEHDADDAELE